MSRPTLPSQKKRRPTAAVKFDSRDGNLVSDQPGQRLMTAATATALLLGLALGSPARADTVAPGCVAPVDLVRLANPLLRVAQKIASGEPVTIVAIGSSSTAGGGARVAAAQYLTR